MVEEGKVQWKVVVSNFYPDLDEAVKTAEKELESVKIEDEVTDVICEECGRNMVIKYGPHGKFLACPVSRIVEIPNHIWRKLEFPVRSAEKKWSSARRKKAESITDVKIIQSASLCHGRSHPREKSAECGGYMVEKGNKLVCADEQCGYVRNLKKN